MLYTIVWLILGWIGSLFYHLSLDDKDFYPLTAIALCLIGPISFVVGSSFLAMAIRRW